MGKVSPERIPKTMKLFQQDLPVLVCAVGIVEDTDEYWKEVLYWCNETYKKHNSELAKRLVMTIAEYLDDQAKLKRGKG